MEIAPALRGEGQSGERHAALLWRLSPWLVLLALVALCSWLLIVPIEALFVRIPINYDEGWNAIHAQRLMSGGPLYPQVASGITINYPPLSFYVVGALGKLIGDYIFAGRIVALVSQAVVAINVAVIAERIGTGRLFALIAAILFVLFIEVYFSDYVAMDDPQWLGHALQTSALVLLLRNNVLSSRRLAIAALLLLLGGLTKQSLLALPLAATIWIAWQDRHRLGPWLGWGAAWLLIAAAAGYAAYGQAIFDQVIANPRNFTASTLLWMAQNIAPRLLPFALFACGGFALGRNDRRVWLVGTYAAVAAAAGVVLMSAQGVIYNALFDFVIATMPLAALLGKQMQERLAGRVWTRTAMALILALPFLALAPNAGDNYRNEAGDLAQAAQWRQTIATLARAPGPVICQQLSLCYWAGRPSAVDVFSFGQRATRDPGTVDALARRIDDGEFALIEEDDVSGGAVLPGAVNSAIDGRYRTLTTEPARLLVPRQAVSATP